MWIFGVAYKYYAAVRIIHKNAKRGAERRNGEKREIVDSRRFYS